MKNIHSRQCRRVAFSLLRNGIDVNHRALHDAIQFYAMKISKRQHPLGSPGWHDAFVAAERDIKQFHTELARS